MGCGASPHPVAPDAAAARQGRGGRRQHHRLDAYGGPPPASLLGRATCAQGQLAGDGLDAAAVALSRTRRARSIEPARVGGAARHVDAAADARPLGVAGADVGRPVGQRASPDGRRRSHLGQSREARDAASSSSRRLSRPRRRGCRRSRRALGDGGSPSKRPGSSGSAKSGGGGSSLAGLGSRSRSKANVMERRSLDELDLPRERPPEREKQRSHSIDSGMEGSLRCAAAHVLAFSAIAPGPAP